MNVLIFGASGATGQHLVQQGLDLQHHITAFVRNPGKLAIRHKRLTIVEGNVNNYRAVAQAIERSDAVLSALGANNMFKYDEAIVNGMENVIRAMQWAQKERLIYLSTNCVRNARKDAGFFAKHIAPVLIQSEIRGHEAREKMIRESQLKWTIVQAATLTKGPLIQIYSVGETLATRSFMSKVSRADVAHFMLKELSDNKFINKAVRILPGKI